LQKDSSKCKGVILYSQQNRFFFCQHLVIPRCSYEDYAPADRS